MKTRVYVDGFNFYYAIRRGDERGDFQLGLGWCDFRKLAEQHLIRSEQVVDTIKYFTAPVERFAIRSGEERRQRLWLDALSTIQGIQIIEGLHQKHERKPREEKQTDINIAVELLIDAINGECDRAILITGDIDQAPAVNAARRRLPHEKRVEVDVWVPPGLAYGRWRGEAAKRGFSCKQITVGMLEDSRLPDRIVGSSGKVIDCLPEWLVT